MRLIDDEAQPPLVKVEPAPVAAGTSAPGPRISAFAAATGAAIAPTPPRPDTDPPVASSMVEQAADGRPAALSSPTPASAARPGVESIEPSGPPGHLVDPGTPAREQIRADRTEAAAPEGGGVLLADDDDFGPLVLPEPTRRSRRRSRDASRPQESGAGDRRPRRAGAAVGVLLLVLACVGVWWVTARPSPTTTASPAGVAMVDWRGIALPVSSSAGPTELTETRASGFARSALGRRSPQPT